MDINKYIIELDMMRCWFREYTNTKYYEFTMRELITIYSYNEIINKKTIPTSVENNLIRLIEDNKIFIHDHLLKIGLLQQDLEI